MNTTTSPFRVCILSVLGVVSGMIFVPAMRAQTQGATENEPKSISAAEIIDVVTKPSAEELAKKEEEEPQYEADMQAEFGPLRAMASSFPLISISTDPATRPVFVSIDLKKQALLRNGRLTGAFRLKVDARAKDALYFAFFTFDGQQPRWLAIYPNPRLPISNELRWNVLRYSRAFGMGLADDSPVRKYLPAGNEVIRILQVLTQPDALVPGEELLFIFQFPEASPDYVVTLTYAFSPWAKAKGTTDEEEIKRVLGIPE